jgi:prepilin-type processing-associated H-X9-DG protein
MLPYIEQQNIPYNLTKNWDDPANRLAVQVPIKILLCPSAPRSSQFDTDSPVRAAVGDYPPIHGVNSGYCRMVGWPLLQPPDTNGVLTDRRCAIAQIIDGTSQTFLLVEDAGRPHLFRMGRRADGVAYAGGWADPNYEIALDGSDTLTTGQGQGFGPCVMNCTSDNETYSFHPGGANMLFADGSVRFVRDSIRKETYAALCTRASGEVISDDY